MRPWRCGALRAWYYRGARPRSRLRTSHQPAPGKVHRINAPPFTRAAIVTRHAPAQCQSGKGRHVDDGRHKALRIAAPRLATCNGTTPISGDSAVVAAHYKAAPVSKNVLERIATVGAELDHATVEPHIGIGFGCFKIEIVPECQLTAAADNTNRQGIEPLVAKYCGIINESRIG
jgi:hypothetical protein